VHPHCRGRRMMVCASFCAPAPNYSPATARLPRLVARGYPAAVYGLAVRVFIFTGRQCLWKARSEIDSLSESITLLVCLAWQRSCGPGQGRSFHAIREAATVWQHSRPELQPVTVRHDPLVTCPDYNYAFLSNGPGSAPPEPDRLATPVLPPDGGRPISGLSRPRCPVERILDRVQSSQPARCGAGRPHRA
jgi:hypothetical protein